MGQGLHGRPREQGDGTVVGIWDREEAAVPDDEQVEVAEEARVEVAEEVESHTSEGDDTPLSAKEVDLESQRADETSSMAHDQYDNEGNRVTS